MKMHLTNNVNEKVYRMKSQRNVFDSGRVIKINDYIIEVSGLENAMYFEKVIIMEKGVGYVNAIYENSVSIAVVKEDAPIEIGDIVNSTNELFKAIFSKSAVGNIMNFYGIDQLSGRQFEHFKYIDVERPEIPIMDREKISRPLLTGISAIDLLCPIGKGQRQAIIGDKRTGKTQIALDIIVHQREVAELDKTVCIYIAIGKNKKEIKTIYNELRDRNALEYTMLLVATNDDKTPIINLVPYAGMSIAEEFMKDGKDVIVVIDDLKRHAEIYKEISLLSGKNVNSYPSDMFYVHSKLLERGCEHKNGGSITVLPIVETTEIEENNIAKNIVSITDGQIVLSNSAFIKGQKPAIDYGKSVSRLGNDVQKDELKELGTALRLKLLNDLEMRSVFESVKQDETNEEVKEKLKECRQIELMLRQEKFSALSVQDMVDRFEDFI